MMEILLATAIIALAGLGLGVGLMLGRGPVKSSCGATACLPKEACADCPNRRAMKAEKAS